MLVTSNFPLNQNLTAELIISNLNVRNGTITGGGYATIGNLVVVNIRISKQNTNQVIVTGFPTYSGNNRVSLSGFNYNTGNAVKCDISADGTLTTVDDTDAGLIISGCYIKG